MEVISVGSSNKLNTSFPAHSHDFWEFLYNVSGSGILSTDDEEYSFSPNQIAVIPPGVFHEKRSAEGFWDISMMIRDMRPIAGDTIKLISDTPDNDIGEIMKMALKVSTSDKTHGNKRKVVILNSMGELIYQWVSAIFAMGENRDLRMEKFIESLYINIPNSSFDLSAAIDELGYSKGYFRRVFKAETGQSPVAYLNSIRIEAAKREFASYGTSRAIKDVAMACGFEDPYYFSRVFKKIMGISPQYYIDHLSEYDEKQIETFKNET